MKSQNRFYMVDVFAPQAYAGNPLAVVVCTQALPDVTMQRIAAEINFSETSFVSAAPDSNGGYSVRVFTPVREIAFTGHPILGTAWVLRTHVDPNPSTGVSLNLAVGTVEVIFEDAADGSETAWFRAPPMTLGAIADPGLVAEALGISASDIAVNLPVQVVSAGTAAMIVALNSLDALRRCKLNLDNFAGLASAGFPPLVYLYCDQTHDSQNDFCARFFFEAGTVREDPATGNGAAFLGAYLLEHRCFAESSLSLRIEQGHELGRPSLVMLRAKLQDGVAEISIGGRVIPTVQGELL